MSTADAETSRRRRTLEVLGFTLVVAIAGAATGVWAAHSFTDVPTSHPFHGQIGAVSDACIAGGFPDGTYRPSDDVTRQAMAAFLARTGSRATVQQSEGSVSFGAGNPRPTLRTVTVAAPSLSGCTQWALIQAGANVFSNSTHADTCVSPTSFCNGELYLSHNGTVVASGFVRFSGNRDGSRVHLQHLVALPGGSGNHSFALEAGHNAVKETRGIITGPSISVTVLPFGTVVPAAASAADSELDESELEALLRVGGTP